MSVTENPIRAGAYRFSVIESKWQRYWEQNRIFASAGPGDAGFDSQKPKRYVLDMFPYPSGAGLHVGHPLGYCASDVYSRFLRMRGFNVLHPMGFDAFGLPAEQYAIETGVHPAETTRKNIDTYRRQLKAFGFSYDWEREIASCEPDYYRHTQWIFLQLYKSWYDERMVWTDAQGREHVGRARPIDELVRELEAGRFGVDEGLNLVRAPRRQDPLTWKALSAEQRRSVLDQRRLAFLAEVPVNWCPGLGTVLSNEEVTNEGRSERGDYPVYRRPLKQWMLRITAYADRLLSDLDPLDWPEAIKLMQRNWIGRSEGAEVDFKLASGEEDAVIRIFTTRPDTLFGATYMVLAPEHPRVEKITTSDQRIAVRRYVEQARHRSELDRTSDTKTKTGVFTGAYAINPVNNESIPVWVADYVLMGYGTGAIMSVPAGDTRDFEFAKQFGLPIRAVVQPPDDWLAEQVRMGNTDADYCRQIGRAELPELVTQSAFSAGYASQLTEQDILSTVGWDRSWIPQTILPMYLMDPGIFLEAYVGEGTAIKSGQFDGLPTAEFKKRIVDWLAERGLGRGTVNTKLRDWVFSRQKYWGEPFPILHGEDGEIVPLDEDELPLKLPPVRDFKPTPSNDAEALPQPPLGRATDWVNVERNGRRYRRDLNTMPQWAGSCWYYLRYLDPRNPNQFSAPEAERYWMAVDLYIGGAEHAVLHLLYARFWHKVLFDLGHVSTPEPFMKLVNQGMIQGNTFRDGRGVLVYGEDVEEVSPGAYRRKSTGEPLVHSFEKMSKSMRNVVNPDEVIAEYGADAFRMYELFMGPIETSKPWQTRDVPGLYKLLGRIWRLVVDEHTDGLSSALTNGEGDPSLLRSLHKTIKKVGDDIEQFKFNTAIATIFDFVNTATRCEHRPRSVIEKFVLVLSPFAPHIAEELWERLGHTSSLSREPWPEYDPAWVTDDTVEIAVQINGKVRSRLTVAATSDQATQEAAALADAKVSELLAGKTVRKVIVVPGRLVNIIAT